jgi:hypothetical protein
VNTAMTAAEPNDIEAWAAIEEVSDHLVAAASTPRTATIDAELYDSGASTHMSPFREKFTTYREIVPCVIIAADKWVFYAIGVGDLKIEVPHGESSTSVILREVLHAPDMAMTIVSISRITKLGNSVTFEKESCTIKNAKGKVVGTIKANANGLYRVEHPVTASAAVTPK